jgi:hypothetical protein
MNDENLSHGQKYSGKGGERRHDTEAKLRPRLFPERSEVLEQYEAQLDEISNESQHGIRNGKAPGKRGMEDLLATYPEEGIPNMAKQTKLKEREIERDGCP